MGNFYTEATERKARLDHECSYCAEIIFPGDYFKFQKGRHDGKWFESKMHPECFDFFCEHGDGEYIECVNERPCYE